MENRSSNCTSSCRINTGGSYSQNHSVSRPQSSAAVSVQKPCKKDLIDKINQYSFALNEATLFLDTHPYDTDALAFFQKYRDLRVESVKEYAKYYAPLVIDFAACDKTPWSWAAEPWPWEGVDC